MKKNKYLSEKINLLTKIGKTRQMLSVAADVSEGTISTWINGQKSIRAKNLNSLAQWLKIPVELFYDDTLPSDFINEVKNEVSEKEYDTSEIDALKGEIKLLKKEMSEIKNTLALLVKNTDIKTPTDHSHLPPIHHWSTQRNTPQDKPKASSSPVKDKASKTNRQ